MLVKFVYFQYGSNWLNSRIPNKIYILKCSHFQLLFLETSLPWPWKVAEYATPKSIILVHWRFWATGIWKTENAVRGFLWIPFIYLKTELPKLTQPLLISSIRVPSTRKDWTDIGSRPETDTKQWHWLSHLSSLLLRSCSPFLIIIYSPLSIYMPPLHFLQRWCFILNSKPPWTDINSFCFSLVNMLFLQRSQLKTQKDRGRIIFLPYNPLKLCSWLPGSQSCKETGR